MAGRRSRWNVDTKQLLLNMPPSTIKAFNLWAVGEDLSPSELLHNLTAKYCPAEYLALVGETLVPVDKSVERDA